MTTGNHSTDTLLRWHVDDEPFDRIEQERIREDRDLFYFLVGASFVEITSDLFSRSLTDYYAGDEALTEWLQREWEPQEVQHGVALRRYVQTVWPEFDWQSAYEDFRRNYAPLCRPDLFGPTQGLELASRCVVETGTATIYTMVRDLTEEPVLRRLASLIRTDEVAHYSHFFQHFKRYRSSENLRRTQVLRTVWGRVGEIDDEDAWFAFRSISRTIDPGVDAARAYRQFRSRIRARLKAHYPYDMAATMLLKPLQLNRRVQRLAVPALAAGAKHLMGRMGR